LPFKPWTAQLVEGIQRLLLLVNQPHQVLFVGIISRVGELLLNRCQFSFECQDSGSALADGFEGMRLWVQVHFLRHIGNT